MTDVRERPAHKMPEQGALSIGEVINLLKEEFPEISVSKVRFLEDQGLIHPSRSPSGYRQFFAPDLKRLRFILGQQRDHFLPLKVIKSRLTDWERGEDLETGEQQGGGRFLEHDEQQVSRLELLKRTSLTGNQLDELISHGLIRPPDGSMFTSDGLAIALEAKELIDRGLEPRHLRILRIAAEREVDLLRQLGSSVVANPKARAEAKELLSSAARSFEAIHLRLIRTELRELFDL